MAPPYDPSPVPAENYKPCPSRWSALALDTDGAIVTVGDDVRFPDAGGPTDILLRKHDPDGGALWTYYNQNAPDGFEGSDAASDIDVTPDGAIVAVGSHASRPWVGRFAPGGDAEWIRISTGEGATEVEASSDGISYVGIMTGEIDGPRFRIARFDSDGSETTIARVSLIHPRGVHMAATPDGGLVYVLRGATPLLRKIDASGAAVWDRLMDFAARDDECSVIDVRKALATAVGPDGSIYVELEGKLARYSADGDFLSVHLHDVYAAHALAVGPDGAIALADRRHVIMSAPLDPSP